jgi:hypothetical protein
MQVGVWRARQTANGGLSRHAADRQGPIEVDSITANFKFPLRVDLNNALRPCSSAEISLFSRCKFPARPRREFRRKGTELPNESRVEDARRWANRRISLYEPETSSLWTASSAN